jgi:hypothetical protein
VSNTIFENVTFFKTEAWFEKIKPVMTREMGWSSGDESNVFLFIVKLKIKIKDFSCCSHQRYPQTSKGKKKERSIYESFH